MLSLEILTSSGFTVAENCEWFFNRSDVVIPLEDGLEADRKTS